MDRWREDSLGKTWHGLWKEMSHFTNHSEFFRDGPSFIKRDMWGPKAFPKDIRSSPKLVKKLSCCRMNEAHRAVRKGKGRWKHLLMILCSSGLKTQRLTKTVAET